MKRGIRWIVFVSALFVLMACSKSPKNEFIDAYEALSTSAQKGGDFELTFDDFQMTDTTGAAWANLLGESIKNMNVKGSYQIADDNSYAMDMTLEALGQQLPLEISGKGEEAYLSTSFIEGMVNVMNGFGVPMDVDQAQLTALSGKYITVESADADGSLDITAAVQEGKENQKVFIEMMKKTADDQFKKDGTTLSHTFTKEELTEFATSDSLDEETQATIEQATVIATIKDKKTLALKIDLADAEAGITLAMKIAVTPKAVSGTITLPKADEIVSETEVQRLFDSTGLAEPDATDTDLSEAVLSDADFEEFYQQVADNLDSLPLDYQEEFLNDARNYLTDEQYKKLQELFDQQL